MRDAVCGSINILQNNYSHTQTIGIECEGELFLNPFIV